MSLLEVAGLSRFYGAFQALFSLSLHVDQGETVALIGSNGAGKSTALRSIAGAQTTGSGSIRFDGREIAGLSPQVIAALGIALVPEGRRLFPSLTVEENLLMGATCNRAGHWNLKRVYALFPVLETRRHSPATQLSGGQQQMVALGRALMSNPRLLLIDELSLGLAPNIVGEIYDRLGQLRGEGIGMLIVEQNVSRALSASKRLYCLRTGTVALSGASDQISVSDVSAAYFGAAS